MRIADAVLDARTIPVNFAGGAVLTITYQMASVTPADMSRMVAEAEAAEDRKKASGKAADALDQASIDRMVQSMVDLLVEWDLTDNNDAAIPVTFEGLQNVPTPVFTQIMKAVTKDQKESGEADETSAGG